MSRQTPDLRHAVTDLLGPPPATIRPIPTLTDADRSAAVTRTGGEPIFDVSAHSNTGSTPYIDYLHVDVLLSLQHPRSDEQEEMTFITFSHVMELMFKLLCHEALCAQDALRRDALPEAQVTLKRMHRSLDFMTGTWSVLSTITPHGYLRFRDSLGIGSGFESFMYRRLEFMLGNKQPRMLQPHVHVPAVHAALECSLHAPSLYDDAIAHLARQGHAVGDTALARDWSQPYQADPAVQAAWRRVYRECTPSDPLYGLAEALVDLADRFKQWRFRHFVTVERLIGFKPGTGGTGGVAWLRHITDQNIFPELWALRSEL